MCLHYWTCATRISKSIQAVWRSCLVQPGLRITKQWEDSSLETGFIEIAYVIWCCWMYFAFVPNPIMKWCVSPCYLLSVSCIQAWKRQTDLMPDRETERATCCCFLGGREGDRESESTRTKGDRWCFGVVENGVAHSRHKWMPVLNFMAVLVPWQSTAPAGGPVSVTLTTCTSASLRDGEPKLHCVLVLQEPSNSDSSPRRDASSN